MSGARRMRRAFAVAVVTACVGISAGMAFAAGRGSRSSIFFADHGKFKITVNGVQAGQETFDIGPHGDGWVAHGRTEIQTAKGVTHVRGDLELNPDGTPVRYQWSMDRPKKATATITFKGSVATIDLHVEGTKPYLQTFTFASPNIAILDNNMYDQFAILAQLYNWQKKGQQTFPVLIPQELTPGSVTLNSLGEQESGGKKLKELQVTTADLEVDLFLDGKKLVRIVSPSTNAEIDRE